MHVAPRVVDQCFLTAEDIERCFEVVLDDSACDDSDAGAPLFCCAPLGFDADGRAHHGCPIVATPCSR